MQDQRHQKLAGLLVPDVHRVLRAGRVDQHLDDVLRIAHLVVAFANLKERIESGAVGLVGIEEQAVAACASACPAVTSHNSFFTSYASTLPFQFSRVGMTWPTPLPDRLAPRHKLMFGAVVGEITVEGMSQDGSLAGQQARPASCRDLRGPTVLADLAHGNVAAQSAGCQPA